MSLTYWVRRSLEEHLRDWKRDLWIKLLMEAAMVGMLVWMMCKAFGGSQ